MVPIDQTAGLRSHKRCTYCGRENDPAAIACRECGTAFVVPKPPMIVPPECLQHTPKSIVLRLAAAATVGLVVTVISIHVAWLNGRDARTGRLEQWLTQRQLRAIDLAITHYQASSKKPPTSIDELLKSPHEIPSPSVRDDGVLLDGWQRPFLFKQDGSNVLVISMGRDGKPGGEGLDCDLSNKDWRPAHSVLTFGQFLWEMPKVRGMILSCLLCGVLAFVLAFATVKASHFTRLGLAALTKRIVATLIGAVVVAWFISALHIPSGH
jgi:hypothetical protein